ncbi:MAG TPA: acyloxyacyl hydrolase [Chitinophagaceae bacterium]|nr:acyloxyacyl hydrolase [Chitinophagaceae bacterium]
MISFSLNAQDKRAQFSPILKDSYFAVNIGYINYNFTLAQLEPGYTAESVTVPHVAVRVVLFGHRFNDYLAAQITYMRPVGWVEYKNINGTGATRSIRMNVAGLTIRPSLPVSKKLTINGEAGLGIITRCGTDINGSIVVKDAVCGSFLFGGSVGYHLNRNWELTAGTVWSPKNTSVKQPSTVFYSGGFNYTMRSLPKERAEKSKNSGLIFPKNMVQVGYGTNALGYGVNKFVSGTVPIFWGGEIDIKKGVSLTYVRNVYHGKKVFSIDWGLDVSYWKTKKNNEDFFAASIYPVARFTALRTKSTDLYFMYSIAGPTYISRIIMDGMKTGTNFTFRDAMGMGVFYGKKREVNAEIRIAHYSNGNILPPNNGVKIPLTFTFGYTFD